MNGDANKTSESDESTSELELQASPELQDSPKKRLRAETIPGVKSESDRPIPPENNSVEIIDKTRHNRKADVSPDAFDGFRMVAHGIRDMFASATLCAGIGAISLGITWAAVSWLAINATSAYLISTGVGFVGAVIGSQFDKKRNRLELPFPRKRQGLALAMSQQLQLQLAASPCPRCQVSVSGNWSRTRCEGCGLAAVPFTAIVNEDVAKAIRNASIRHKDLGDPDAFLVPDDNEFAVIVLCSVAKDKVLLGSRSAMSVESAMSLLSGLDNLSREMVRLAAPTLLHWDW